MPHKDPEVRRAYLREYHAKWYAANKEGRKEQVRQYKRENAGYVAAKNAEYRARDEVRERATMRKQLWRETNRERDQSTRRRWSKQNRHRLREYDRRYRQDRSEYNRTYYLQNREYLRHRDRLRYIARRDGVGRDQYELMLALGKP